TSANAAPWIMLNGWYEGAGSCDIGLRTSAGNTTPMQAIISNGPPTRNFNFPTARVRITTPPAAVTPNGDVQFLVEIRPGLANTRVQGGTWRLLVNNTGNSAVRLDVWSIVPPNAGSAAFQAPAESDDLKVGSPGCAASVITAAAYTTRNQWIDAGGSPHAVG